MIDQIFMTLKAIGGATIVAGIVWLLAKWNAVMEQKRKNEIKEIDLTNTKITLDNQSKPLNYLVSESNKSHGVDEVVKKPGSDDSKG